MSLLLRSLVLMATAGALTFPTNPPASVLTKTSNGSGRGRAVSLSTQPGFKASQLYKESNLEYYLNDDGIAYIRPGLKIKIVGATNVASGQRPVVEILMTDDMGQPLDRNGILTPGKIEADFLFARWNPVTSEYVNLNVVNFGTVTYPLHDLGGTWTDIETGHAKFTFAKPLPEGISPNQTITLAIYAGRDTKEIVGKDYAAPATFLDFRPDGGTPAPTFDKVRTAACNNCHDPLAFHTQLAGQKINDVKLCVTCHTSQMPTFPNGETLDFKLLIHKVHNARNLASVKAGTPYAPVPGGEDFSNITYPQDIRNCATCHVGTDPKNKPVESGAWLVNPARRACGSCHDDVNWTTGENHAGGAQSDDASCAKCHIPDSGAEFDASIQGAHTIPLKSKQLTGYTASIVSVSNATPGNKPTVVFSVKTAAGTAVDATKLSSFSPKWGVNTGNYTVYKSESGVATGANPGSFDAASGNTSYTFTNAIPADAKGTITFSTDIYNSTTLQRVDGKKGDTVRDAVFNPIKYVSLDGSPVTPRRTSVVMSNCNQCHQDLALHGSQRKNIEECVICHNPLEGDQARRPATAGVKESVSFQRLIHRIHTGEELTQDFTVYGFGGSKNNFNEVTFPGDRRNCAKCHVSTAAYSLPIAKTAGPVTTLRDYFSPQGPATAACLGCHDGQDTAAHAYLNVATFPGATTSTEACTACHGTGKEFAVAKVHAR